MMINKVDYDNLLKEASDMAKQLAEYKNLEEEIGCPLEVVFKALKQNCIYTKNGERPRTELRFNSAEWCICCGTRTQVRVADYKKTWWLRKDKSE